MEDIFAFFGIPLQFWPDEQGLKKKYLQHTREWHPDHAGQNPEQKSSALKLSAQNNEYYQILQKFDSRLEWILKSWGMAGEGEKNTLSQDFLLEMLEVNDLIEAAAEGDQEAGEQADQWIALWTKRNEEQLEMLTKKYDQQPEPALKNTIQQAYQQRKYLQRLKSNRAGEREN